MKNRNRGDYVRNDMFTQSDGIHTQRFVAIYTLFGDLWAKKVLFGSKTVFLGQEVHYYMVYFAYFTELILQICDYAQKLRI